MVLFILAYLGGILTIVSPCILPVLPFVFAQADRPFVKSGLPLLLGMILTFAVVATLAAVGGGWVVQANQYGRYAAIALMAFFGVALLFPQISDHLTRPLVALGSRLSQSAQDQSQGSHGSFLPSFLLGIATGLLWAPCAGPILGLVLTGAALSGANLQTSLLLAAYAAGAATSLALALLIGGRVFKAMKQSLGTGEWIRRGLGVAVLLAVVLIASGMDTGLLTRLSLTSTSSLEQALVDKIAPPAPSSVLMAPEESSGAMMMSGNNAMMAAGPAMMAMKGPQAAQGGLPIEGPMPPLAGAVEWLNSPPLTAEQLRGKVVVIDFWTYSCINCLRAIPYVQAWADKYKDQGLVVIGIHAPEFAFERTIDNVKQAVKDLKITYPVAIDNDYALWRAFGNSFWPAHYFIDAQGNIRHHHFGEGDYEHSEKIIQQLLIEAGQKDLKETPVTIAASGAQAAADTSDVKSPETYVGYGRAENFASPGGAVQDKPSVYQSPATLTLNQWGLSGNWTVTEESATETAPKSQISYQFHARDLHLVLGSEDASKPIHFRVLLDGKAPGSNHGMDIDADGYGVITGHRLYQLIRQSQPIEDHLFQIEFLDPGAQAYAFTFG